MQFIVLQATLLPFHILAGGLAIILGAAALIARKGGVLHRRLGLLFVCTMVAMGLSGTVLALRQDWLHTSGPPGLLAAYCVVTALTTVRTPSLWSRRINAFALAVAITLTIVELGLGIRALSSPGRQLNGVSFFVLFFFAAITLLSAAGDILLMRRGRLPAPARLARHLWRMCFALFLAAAAFFSIRERVAKILPDPFTSPAMRALPVLLVLVTMFYWLWRVRRHSARYHNGDAQKSRGTP